MATWDIKRMLSAWRWQGFSSPELAIQTRGDFRMTMQQERTRADRYQRDLSLLTLDLARGQGQQPSGRLLARALLRRLRSSDQIGWLEHQVLGVLLPETPGEGAWQLSEEILKALEGSLNREACRVYTYPSKWLGAAADKPLGVSNR